MEKFGEKKEDHHMVYMDLENAYDARAVDIYL